MRLANHVALSGWPHLGRRLLASLEAAVPDELGLVACLFTKLRQRTPPMWLLGRPRAQVHAFPRHKPGQLSPLDLPGAGVPGMSQPPSRNGRHLLRGDGLQLLPCQSSASAARQDCAGLLSCHEPSEILCTAASYSSATAVVQNVPRESTSSGHMTAAHNKSTCMYSLRRQHDTRHCWSFARVMYLRRPAAKRWSTPAPRCRCPCAAVQPGIETCWLQRKEYKGKNIRRFANSMQLAYRMT